MMRLVARGVRCFELTLDDTTLLLDFDAGDAGLLQYEPFLSRAERSKEQRCVRRGERWLLQEELQLALPEMDGLELHDVEALLVSSADAMLSLPWLTEYSPFRGAVYATAASIQMGRQLMLELAALHQLSRSRPPSQPAGPAEAAPAGVAGAMWEQSCGARRLYTSRDVEACVARMSAVSFGEVVRLGVGLQAVALPAGATIGGAVWHVSNGGSSFVSCAAALLPNAALVPRASAGAGSTADDGSGEGGVGLGGESEWTVGASRELELPPPHVNERAVLMSSLRDEATATAGAALMRASASSCTTYTPAIFITSTTCTNSTTTYSKTNYLSTSTSSTSVPHHLHFLHFCPSPPPLPPLLSLPTSTSSTSVPPHPAARQPAKGLPLHKRFPFSQEICRTCAAGGNVLVPCAPHGATLSLLELLSSSLLSRGIRLPIFLISPIASSALGQAALHFDFLDAARKRQALRPDAAFAFERMQQSGALVCAESLADLSAPLSSPAVVLAAHPSLRLGDAPLLLNMWKEQPSSLLLLTWPCDDLTQLLAPFQPLRMRSTYCPLDLRLSADEAATVCRTLQPQQLLLPAPPSPPSPPLSARADPFGPLALAHEGVVTRVPMLTPLKLRLKRSFETAIIKGGAAASLPPLRHLGSGVKAARITANVTMKQGQLILEPAAPGERSSKGELYGSPDATRLLEALHRRGLSGRLLPAGEDGAQVVEVQGYPGTRIELRSGETTVRSDDFETGVLLREALLEQLTEL
ncbi:hypothetical protein AB1Y20_002108 [Prymnesium parvum]|uniref:Beta-Casp domain-containing protein n=1 Tax=Prymnesium parvum TaxID=97485 RepID=A0AB34JAA2_PRYPA